MTERTTTLRADEPTSEGEARTDVRADSPSHSSTPELWPRRLPLFMPRGQRYYWLREWQQGEAEAEAELRRGEGVTFENVQDAFRWLTSPED
jgi:hypothetical protein